MPGWKKNTDFFLLRLVWLFLIPMDLSLFFDLFEAYFQDAPNAYVPIVLKSQKFFKEPAVQCLVLTVTHLDKQAWELSSY